MAVTWTETSLPPAPNERERAGSRFQGLIARLAAMVRHRINNPLQTIVAEAQLLSDAAEATPEVRASGDSIQQSARRIAAFVAEFEERLAEELAGQDIALAAPVELPTRRQERFLVLAAVETHRVENQVSCRVELRRLSDTFTAEAGEIDSEGGRARAAARATLDAAAQATGVNLALEGVHVLELFGRRYVALSVEATHARRFLQLSGLSAATTSVEDAACLAALDAIERWLAG